jgi:hypothetical protein
MLDRGFFKMEINKLVSQFGDRSFSQHRVDLVYKAVCNLDDKELAYIVDDIIGNSKFAPTVSDFRDKARSFLADKPRTSKHECSTCDSSGYFVAKRRDGSAGEYAFRCRCLNGNMYQAFQMWDGKFNKYLTTNYSTIGADDYRNRN